MRVLFHRGLSGASNAGSPDAVDTYCSLGWLASSIEDREEYSFRFTVLLDVLVDGDGCSSILMDASSYVDMVGNEDVGEGDCERVAEDGDGGKDEIIEGAFGMSLVS